MSDRPKLNGGLRSLTQQLFERKLLKMAKVYSKAVVEKNPVLQKEIKVKPNLKVEDKKGK